MFKSYNNIKNIEIYAGNAHSALERKVVTDRADIKYIINKIKKINVVRNAKSSDIIESGVGLQFKINSFDDETYSFVINDKLLFVGSKAYVISGSSFNYEFYKKIHFFSFHWILYRIVVLRVLRCLGLVLQVKIISVNKAL